MHRVFTVLIEYLRIETEFCGFVKVKIRDIVSCRKRFSSLFNLQIALNYSIEVTKLKKKSLLSEITDFLLPYLFHWSQWLKGSTHKKNVP